MLLDQDPIPLFMVSYHRPNDFQRCLKSILATEQAFHLHVIDNSGGGLDNELDRITDARVTVHKNAINKGKGCAFMERYRLLESKCQWLISIDADIEVPPDWIIQLLVAARRILSRHEFGLLAPIILRDEADSLARQMRHGFTMHTSSETTKEIIPGIYYNRHTAGPLLLINKAFFDDCGGYPTSQLYGNEDGRLCAEAARRKLFAGFTTNLQVRHLNADSDDGYIMWKRRNVRAARDEKGYWG